MFRLFLCLGISVADLPTDDINKIRKAYPFIISEAETSIKK